MSGWANITTLEGWKTKLRELMNAAKNASEKNDSKARLRICRDLLTFIEKSDPAIFGTEELDDIAIKAHQRLSQDVVKDAVDQIRARTADVVALTKAIERVVSEADAEAVGLRLTRVHAAVDSLTRAARTLESLDKVLIEGPDKSLRDTVVDLAAAIRKARGLIETNT
jgi:hypothetical protein